MFRCEIWLPLFCIVSPWHSYVGITSILPNVMLKLNLALSSNDDPFIKTFNSELVTDLREKYVGVTLKFILDQLLNGHNFCILKNTVNVECGNAASRAIEDE